LGVRKRVEFSASVRSGRWWVNKAPIGKGKRRRPRSPPKKKNPMKSGKKVNNGNRRFGGEKEFDGLAVGEEKGPLLSKIKAVGEQ